MARFAGRRKGLFLILLIAPFWISYMMRMLAWVDLLQTERLREHGAVGWVGISPVNWLGGKPVTVVLGLVYGYIPYLILVLYAGLDRIDPALIEAGRDLGLSKLRTFVTSPCRCPGRRSSTGLLITVLPMLGDYYTNQLLSGAASTSMIGNLIQGQLGTPGLAGQGAVLSLLLLRGPADPDDLLRDRHQPNLAGGIMTAPSTAGTAVTGLGAAPAPSRRRNAGSPGQPVASPVAAGGLHLAVPALVAGADRDRRAVLLQQGRSQATWQGFSTRLVLSGTKPTRCCTTRSLHAAVIQTRALRC